MKRQRKHSSQEQQVQTGTSFVDTVVGIGILLIVTAGVVELFGMALSRQKAQASAAARTAELARDKMQGILRFCGDTTSYGPSPASHFTDANLAGCDPRMAAAQIPATGGSLDTRHPVAHYVDYLDADGNPISATAQWQYICVWQVSVPPSASAAGARQIAVKAQARLAFGSNPAAESTIVTTRSFPLR
jgi:hypothetical protein